jgi:hypothetical protein
MLLHVEYAAHGFANLELCHFTLWGTTTAAVLAAAIRATTDLLYYKMPATRAKHIPSDNSINNWDALVELGR